MESARSSRGDRSYEMTSDAMTEAQHPKLLTNRYEVRAEVIAARQRDASVGLVPTMGALHEGHLSLVRAAREDCDVTIVTIFVNPTQFGPQEDLAEYPRTMEDDLAALRELEVDFVYAPSTAELYPDGFSTHIEPPDVAKPFEGQHRPGHFRGVTTIVLKLFNIIPARMAFFGEKDYQQYLAIKRMVTDLNLPILIVPCPTVRDADGLALSSRNRYLSESERQQALAISQSLDCAEQAISSGANDLRAVAASMRQMLDEAGIDRVDYVEIADAETLDVVDRFERNAVALIAAHVGNTRLIDNRILRRD